LSILMNPFYKIPLFLFFSLSLSAIPILPLTRAGYAILTRCTIFNILIFLNTFFLHTPIHQPSCDIKESSMPFYWWYFQLHNFWVFLSEHQTSLGNIHNERLQRSGCDDDVAFLILQHNVWISFLKQSFVTSFFLIFIFKKQWQWQWHNVISLQNILICWGDIHNISKHNFEQKHLDTCRDYISKNNFRK